MELEQVDLTSYFYQKIIQAIMYDNNIGKILNEGAFDFYIFNQEFLNSLDSFLEICDKSHCIAELEKENLFTLLDYLKHNIEFTSKEEKTRIWNQINELIIKIHKIDVDIAANDRWYLGQMHKRIFRHNLFKTHISRENFEEKKKLIRQSITKDYIVLTFNLYEDTETPEFLEEFGADFYYFMSVNALFVEAEILYSSPEFVRSVRKMCEYYKKHKDEIKHDLKHVKKHALIYKTILRKA